MSCNKRRDTCGGKVNSICVDYNGNIPDITKLDNKDCNTVEDTMQDLYEIVSDIHKQTNIDELSNTCTNVGSGKIKDIVKKHDEILCDLLETVETNNNANLDISNLGLDKKCLADDCATGLNTLKDLLQAIIDKLCSCNC